MKSHFFSTITMHLMIYMLILSEVKVQEFTIKGTLGDCQLLNLENERKPAVGIHKVVWKKGTALVGKMKDQNATTCKLYSERCYVFNNGSLKLCPTLMGDNGQYTAEMFSEDGKHIYSQTVQLDLTEDKVQEFTIKGTLGDCQLLNLENRRKPAVAIHKVVWKKGTALVGKMKDQNATTCRLYSERCYVFNNGSLKLCPTLMGDNGQYTAEMFSEDGKHIYSQTVQLDLTEDKVQEFTIKGTLGDCQLLNLENGRKPAVGIHKVVWKKDTALVGKMEDQNATTCELHSERCYVFNNGSLKLCPTLMGDNGQYTAEMFSEDGKHIYSQTVQLNLTEAEKATNYSHLLSSILMGVHVAVFLVVLGSSTYHFGKWKNKPENKRSALQKPQTIRTVEEGPLHLFINEEETAAAAAKHDIVYTVPLKISTFKGEENTFF